MHRWQKLLATDFEMRLMGGFKHPVTGEGEEGGHAISVFSIQPNTGGVGKRKHWVVLGALTATGPTPPPNASW